MFVGLVVIDKCGGLLCSAIVVSRDLLMHRSGVMTACAGHQNTIRMSVSSLYQETSSGYLTLDCLMGAFETKILQPFNLS